MLTVPGGSLPGVGGNTTSQRLSRRRRLFETSRHSPFSLLPQAGRGQGFANRVCAAVAGPACRPVRPQALQVGGSSRAAAPDARKAMTNRQAQLLQSALGCRLAFFREGRHGFAVAGSLMRTRLTGSRQIQARPCVRPNSMQVPARHRATGYAACKDRARLRNARGDMPVACLNLRAK